MRKKTLLLTLFCHLAFVLSFSQAKEMQIDSLKQVIATAKHDSTIINAWIAWDYAIYKENPQLDFILNQKIDSLSAVNLNKDLTPREKKFFLIKRSFAVNGLGLVYRGKGELDNAISHFQESLELAKQASDHGRVTKALGNIASCYQIRGEYDQALNHFEESLEYCEQQEYTEGIGISLMRIGGIHQLRGDYDQAIEHYQRSLIIHEEVGNLAEIPSALTNIAHVYVKQGNHAQAIINYTNARKKFEENGDLRGASTVLLNIGTIYHDRKDYDKALEYFNESLEIKKKINDQFGIGNILTFKGAIYLAMEDSARSIKNYREAYETKKQIGDKPGMGYCLNQIGVFYRKYGQLEEALKHISESLEIQQTAGSKTGIAASKSQLAMTYLAMKNYSKAQEYGNDALLLARDMGNMALIRDASSTLYRAYKKTGQSGKALQMHELFIQSRDSITSENNHQEIVHQEYKYAYEKQALTDSLEFDREKAILSERAKKKEEQLVFGLIAAAIGLILVAIIAVILYIAYRNKQRSNKIIEAEKERSEELLLNILPEEIAEELKQKGHADAQDFEMVTILFTDFKGFTKMSELLTATELVKEIDTCFKAFDMIIEKFGMEKIKTIGDAYMAAGGLPDPDKNPNSPADVVQAGLEMQKYILDRYEKRTAKGMHAFEMRVGVHTGPVVAGIVGVKKFQYDIWGDSVNTASRMESHGAVGEVNVSHMTFKLIETDQRFVFESRGSLDVKGKGSMEMHFVRYA